MANLLGGIEIGGTKLQVVLGDESRRIVQRHRFTVAAELGGNGIRAQIASALKTLNEKPSAFGVGFGGPVDWRTGRICCSHQIEGWNNFEMAAWLQDLAGVPVAIDNDANVAALGEAVVGAGRGRSPVFYVTLGSGVGGGLAINGRIYHGATPGEAEIGHVRLDRDGTLVEERCSGWAVDRLIRKRAPSRPESVLARLIGAGSGGEARFLGEALKEGDAFADEILEETAGHLGFALSHVVHLFHPEIIVIGGGLSLVGEPLRRAVAKGLKRYTMEAFAPGPEVVLAGLGEDAVPIGALELAATAISRSHA